MKSEDIIEYDKELGVHKTYKGFKWQPSPGYKMITFIRPGKTELESVVVNNLEDFKSRIDAGAL